MLVLALGGGAAVAGAVAIGAVMSATAAVAAAPLPAQIEAYLDERPKSVIELQQFRVTASVASETRGGRQGVATLIDLAPAANAWFVLRLEWVGGGDPEVYHLQLRDPATDRLSVSRQVPSGLLLTRAGETTVCDLWGDGVSGPLAAARAGGQVFAPLCDGRIYLRNPTAGHRTSKEWAADFLRDHVWGGERITSLVKSAAFRDAWRTTSSSSPGAATRAATDAAPGPPRLDAASHDRRLDPVDLGISVSRESDGRLTAGAWYPASCCSGVFVGVVLPALLAPREPGTPGPPLNLDSVESVSLVYLVAFDLSRFDLGFAVGTEHPRVGWSERVLPEVKNDSLPGPDGIGTVAPLVRTGMLDPDAARRVAATFAGGFKRSHGAFHWSELASVNYGSHYGFVEQGVVLSKLWPGLATLAVTDEGQVSLRTWQAADAALLPHLRFARQNGVPLVESDPATGAPRPGALVNQWGPGNWSGSEDKKLRSVRSGVALLPSGERGAGPFLVFAYFSSATPAAMERVFEAYGCSYAMLLDMNALEHTYLALYRPESDGLTVEHLIQGMEAVDKEVDGKPIPRFVGFADNRDFFYLTRREAP